MIILILFIAIILKTSYRNKNLQELKTILFSIPLQLAAHPLPIKRKWIKMMLGLITIALLSFSVEGVANEKIVTQTTLNEFQNRPFLLAINRPEGSLAYRYLNLIYTEVFKRLGIAFQIKYIPLKRGFADVASGKYDGETSRVYKYQDSFPTLIRVTESLYSTNVSAFALSNFNVQFNGWNSLKGHNYKIEYPRGVYISEVNLSKVVSPQNLSNITTATQGIKKLLLGRTDIFIDDELVVYPLLETLKDYSSGTIHKIGIMEPVPLYMYIHKKNKWLEPHLNDVIKSMKEEKLMLKYRKMVFNF